MLRNRLALAALLMPVALVLAAGCSRSPAQAPGSGTQGGESAPTAAGQPPASTGASDTPTIRVGYIPVDAMTPLFVTAEKTGPAEGLRIEMVNLPSGAEILTQVSTGDLQVGQGALGAAAFNALKRGLPVKFVAPGHDDWPANTFVVAKNVKGPEDLRGKKVAVNAKGVASEFELVESLKRWNLTYKDVQVTTMPFPDMPAAMESGAIVAGVMTEPVATSAEEKGIGYRPFPHDPKERPVPVTLLFMNSDWMQKSPDLAKRFMVAYLKTARLLNTGKGWYDDEILKIRSKYTNIPVEVLAKTRPTHIDKDLTVDVDSLQQQQQLSKDLGYLQYDQLMKPEEYLDLSLAQQVLRENP